MRTENYEVFWAQDGASVEVEFDLDTVEVKEDPLISNHVVEVLANFGPWSLNFRHVPVTVNTRDLRVCLFFLGCACGDRDAIGSPTKRVDLCIDRPRNWAQTEAER